MTWTPEAQRAVGRALLGSWPGTVAAWGADAIAAYLAELQARGLSAEGVLIAIRTWPAGTDFPPSAPNLAAAARRDPNAPTFAEMLELVYGRGGVLRARPAQRVFAGEAERERAWRAAALERAALMHPLVTGFVASQGVARLRMLPLDDPDYGPIRRKELAAEWAEFVERNEGREVAALVAGRRGEMGAFDPARALAAVPNIDRKD